MYPLIDENLELSRVAQYWTPELHGLSTAEVLDMLLSAFWTGDLPSSRTGDPEEFDAERSRLLSAMSQCDDHPGIRFTTGEVSHVPAQRELPDGAVELDLSIVVRWPVASNLGEVVEALHQAFASLAGASFSDYSDLVKPSLYSLRIAKDTFEAFCLARQYKLPSFWFGKSTGRQQPSPAQALRWLQKRLKNPSPKAVIRAEALKHFPGLSGRRFDKLWEHESLPPQRQKPGPRPK